MSHANARLMPAGRLLMVQRIEAGMPQAHVASQMGLSRGTVTKWWRRWCEGGEAGLADPVVAAAQLASAHPGEGRGADLSSASQHSARTGVSVGANGGAGGDGVADPSAQRV